MGLNTNQAQTDSGSKEGRGQVWNTLYRIEHQRLYPEKLKMKTTKPATLIQIRFATHLLFLANRYI